MGHIISGANGIRYIKSHQADTMTQQNVIVFMFQPNRAELREMLPNFDVCFNEA